MKKFDINSTVKVRLTEFGKKLDKQLWEEFWSSNGLLEAFPYSPPETDSEGYCEFQMWYLMQEFGAYCGIGGIGQEQPFETVILIDEEDLE